MSRGVVFESDHCYVVVRVVLKLICARQDHEYSVHEVAAAPKECKRALQGRAVIVVLDPAEAAFPATREETE